MTSQLAEARACEKCGRMFSPLVRNVRRGGGRYCSRPCYFASDFNRQRTRAELIYRTHGLSNTVEYRAWVHMIGRCEDPNTRGFEYWGGRGICVCEKWRASFPAFLRDVGPRPSPRHSIDRINNDGHYEPDNVRWATRVEQNSNRRRSSSAAVSTGAA